MLKSFSVCTSVQDASALSASFVLFRLSFDFWISLLLHSTSVSTLKYLLSECLFGGRLFWMSLLNASSTNVSQRRMPSSLEAFLECATTGNREYRHAFEWRRSLATIIGRQAKNRIADKSVYRAASTGTLANNIEESDFPKLIERWSNADRTPIRRKLEEKKIKYTSANLLN